VGAQHTPGPWLAAAKPSSVVGLPVVATTNGRSIASVTFFRLGDEFAAHDRESRANARLIALAPDMYEALKLLLSNPLSSEGRKLGLEVIAQLDAEQSQ
jgi:hypothetical protein